ncbi:MAG TPA: cation diffusion facilitator family transporter [Actinomycetes bacterium]|nr:cation diffusion facilitator family transporter [Actinomycetes bacterium]
MGQDHAHSTVAARASERYRPRLIIAFTMAATFLVVETIVAFVSQSLVLLSDAGHMLTDVIGVGMALAAITVASRAGGGRGRRTFGLYRLEVLAALANAILLFGVAGYVLWAAVRRLGDPVDVPATPVLVVAAVGLVLNLVSYLLLRRGAEESMNVRGAAFEVLADAVGSAVVLVVAIVMTITAWDWVDPVAAIGLGLFIVPRAARLAAHALRVLLEAAPPHIDLAGVQADLADIPGVLDVHDLHIWTLTSDMEVATAHVMIGPSTDSHAVLDQAQQRLRERHGVKHATLQLEPSDHTGCDEVGW